MLFRNALSSDPYEGMSENFTARKGSDGQSTNSSPPARARYSLRNLRLSPRFPIELPAARGAT